MKNLFEMHRVAEKERLLNSFEEKHKVRCKNCESAMRLTLNYRSYIISKCSKCMNPIYAIEKKRCCSKLCKKSEGSSRLEKRS